MTFEYTYRPQTKAEREQDKLVLTAERNKKKLGELYSQNNKLRHKNKALKEELAEYKTALGELSPQALRYVKERRARRAKQQSPELHLELKANIEKNTPADEGRGASDFCKKDTRDEQIIIKRIPRESLLAARSRWP